MNKVLLTFLIVFSIVIIVFSFVLFSFSNSYEAADNIEEKFIEAGLVNLDTIDSSIKVDLVNSDYRKNFFRQDFYGDLDKCYLQEEVAIKLKRAQEILKARHPDYSLLVMDGTRPKSVSEAMFDKLKGTPLQKYVANPERGASMHNYGAAVDVTIVNENISEIDMGLNPFRKNIFELGLLLLNLRSGEDLSKEQKQNRQLLRETMVEAGFKPIVLEWWHFNGFDKNTIKEKYEIIE